MHLREQTTSFQVRLEIMEQASAGLNDTQIATALDCSLWTVRRVATKITQAWSYRLSLPDGTSCHWPGEHLSQGMKGDHPSFAQAPSRLGTGHAFSHTQDGCILVRSAASESCTNRQAPQTSRLDARLSTSSRPDPTTSNPTHFSAPEMANGRGIRIMRVDGVGKVSLISIVDAVSRLKAESYPSLETTNPALSDYQLSLRRAFLTYGLPETLTLDHGTVFYDNTTPSPFPTRLHLWLLALGIQVRFTRKRCPTDHAIIERTHQTMTAQALLGQTYTSHTDLWASLDERREVLNHHLPSRALSHKPP